MGSSRKKRFDPRNSAPPAPSVHQAAANNPRPSIQAQNLIYYLLNHIGDEVMLIDRQARIVFVNDATVKGLRVARETLLRRRVIDFYQKKMSLRTWQKNIFSSLKKSGDSMTYRIIREAGDGRAQTIDATAVYMPYKSEEYLLSVARDRTQEISLDHRLKESEALFRLISEGAGDGIFACDLKGNLTYVNPALERLVGVDAAALRGRRFIDYISKETFGQALDCFHQARCGALNLRAEIELASRRGERIPVEINVSPLYKNDEIISIHAIVRDIRSRRHLESVLRQSEKMQAIQNFIAGMAREIRGPMFAVMSLSKRLTQKYKGRNFEYIGYNEFSDMMRSLEEIHQRALYSYETTEQLISLIKKRSGLQRGVSSLNEVIQAAVRLRQSQFRLNGIQLKLKLAKNLPVVALGRIELSQVLDHVLNNAIQAMPGGGGLVISSRFLKKSSMASIEIQDTGVGISREILPHIFEPFFSARQQGIGKSPGLGLAIVHELLKAAQGDIQVKSSLRQGTTVEINLPAGRSKRRR